MQFIETDERRGKGTPEDPTRLVKQLFLPDGTIVLEYDPHADKTSMVTNLLAELKWIK
jgi:hypothetical protein